MSSEASTGSFEVVDLQVKFQGERSYYPSQHPVDSTDREVQSSSQEHLSSHGPTECTSGVTTAEVSAQKVEELARNLVIATKENERYRITMEECNKTLSREVEAAEGRNREIENLKITVESYKVKNAELEENKRSLQEQLSARPAPESWGHQQAISHSADETDYSTSDAVAALREQVTGYAIEIEQLKKMNNDLQQSQSLLEHERDQLKQEHQKLLEDNRNQSQYSSGATQSKSDVSKLERGMERMNLSQNTNFDELQEENQRLNLKIQSKEEEIDKLQKQLFLHTKKEFEEVPSDPAERIAHKNKLMNKLETLTGENEKLRKEINDSQVEVTLHKQNAEQLKKDRITLQEELDKERTRARSYSASSTDLETENRKLATEKSKLETMHSQVSLDYSKVSEELEDARKDLQRVNEELSRRQQELQTKEWERIELMDKLEKSEMSNKQLNEQLRTTSRNLDQAWDSLRHHKQESETLSSRVSETQHQLQQEKEQLNHQLQDARVERDKLLEQLREAYSEKERNEGQLQMLNQNLNVLQSQEEDYKKEKEAMLGHIQQLDANLKASDEKLNETIREYQITVQDLETTVQRKLALEGELKKLRGHYTLVNDERNQLKRTVDERDKEIQELIDAKNKIVQDNSDSMELMRNQLQQYARDYEEERVAREKFAQQMMKLDKSIKEKDEEIDHLQEQLTKYGGSMLRPDLNTSVGGGSNLFGQDHKRRSGEQRQPEPGEFNPRNDRWSGNNKALERNPSASLQGGDDVFTASYPPNTRQPVTMAHPPRPDPSSSANSRMFGVPYGNVPLNAAAGGGGAGMHTGQPQPNLSSNRSAYTEQHPFNPYGQDRTNPPNRPGPNMAKHGDYNARSEYGRPPSDPTSGRGPNMGMPPPHQQPPNSNLDATGRGPQLEPCPLCGKTFPTIEELSQHAALCNY